MHAETTILGAGPAGLAAAITLAAAGRRVRVIEKRSRVGGRFHGDFQGLENWSKPEDVMTEFARYGLPVQFPHRPFHEVIVLTKDGARTVLRSTEPLFYLVRRGPEPDTLDSTLLEQARALGVELEFNQRRDCLAAGGIIATGPSRPNVLAVGYTFATDAPDAAYAVIDPAFAPGGYGYLLIWNGRATVASCMFEDFHQEQQCLDNLVSFIRNRVAIAIERPKRFGGAGNFFATLRLIRDDVLYAGEAAGLQDPLWGFGIRLAVGSGVAAAQALLDGRPAGYAHTFSDDFRRRFEAGLVNRWLFRQLGGRTTGALVRRLERRNDIRAWLHRQYAGMGWRRCLLPWARRSVQKTPLAAPARGCHCAFCQCFTETQETAS